MNRITPPTFRGVPVIENEACQRGTAVLTGYPLDSAFVMHPFDVIALRHPRDPIARLHAVTRYIIDRAHRELDNLARTFVAPPVYRARAEWNPEGGHATIIDEPHIEVLSYTHKGQMYPNPCRCSTCITNPTPNTTALAAEEGFDNYG